MAFDINTRTCEHVYVLVRLCILFAWSWWWWLCWFWWYNFNCNRRAFKWVCCVLYVKCMRYYQSLCGFQAGPSTAADHDELLECVCLNSFNWDCDLNPTGNSNHNRNVTFIALKLVEEPPVWCGATGHGCISYCSPFPFFYWLLSSSGREPTNTEQLM